MFGAPAEEACSRGKKSENMSLMFSFFVSQYVYIHVFVSGYRFDFFFSFIACLESSTAPPSGNSSESPTPTPPSSLPLLSANHEVQHVEVELVTPPPAIIGTSPKTGIIRRTLKYSETDLDAVPLRCYRETDIDEVLLAEQDDADSAFGSNRSVQGTSGAGSSPLGGLANGRTDREDAEESRERGQGAEEEVDEEEVEEEEEEEEIVSWASVRMQGDTRKQQYAAQEETGGGFGHLLKR